MITIQRQERMGRLKADIKGLNVEVMKLVKDTERLSEILSELKQAIARR